MTNQNFTWTMIAHKGEVILVFVPPTAHMNLLPQQARDMAQHLINSAEAAEQQMDSEQKKES